MKFSEESTPLVLEPSASSVNDLSITASLSESASKYSEVKTGSLPKNEALPEPHVTSTENLTSHKPNLQPIESFEAEGSEVLPIESHDYKSSKPLISREETDKSELLTDFSDFDYLIGHMAQSKNKGKIEVLHVFNCKSYLYMKEIFSVFIRKVTLGVLVTNSSYEQFKTTELDMLKQMSSFASKGLVIGSSNSSVENKIAKNSSLYQFSNFLIPEDDKPGSYMFSMNCKQPQNADHTIGASIINRALHLASSKNYPFSWYVFGFKLYNFMTSHNKSAISVSKHTMVIAEKLSIKKPSVEAALEHLTENHIVLYFGDILPDTVFVSVEPFAMIFSELFHKYYSDTHRQPPVAIGHLELTETIKRNAEDNVPVSDFILLFTKLMILAPAIMFQSNLIIIGHNFSVQFYHNWPQFFGANWP